MAQVPYPITEEDAAGIKRQVWNLIRDLYEERLAGLNIGDVFADEGDVLSLQIASSGGLEKVSNQLKVYCKSTGGLQNSSTGVAVKCQSNGGLMTDADGLRIGGGGPAGLFELDVDGALQPVLIGVPDDFYELDTNDDIMPKVTNYYEFDVNGDIMPLVA